MENGLKDIAEYKAFLDELEGQLEREIEKAPKGRLRMANKEKRVDYYHCEEGPNTAGNKGKYLGCQFEELIRDLAQKDYDRKLLKEVSSQLLKLSKIPDGIGKGGLINVYRNLSENRKRLITPRIKTKEEAIAEWLSLPYDPLGFSDEDAVIYTDAGERVRSKSEKLIAQKLKSMGIPYKYECPLNLVGWGPVYPDFTILNKNTMEISWLEHLGRMDDPDYSARTVAKIRTYERSGIFVGKNLFLTMETKQTPFDARYIEMMLEDFV